MTVSGFIKLVLKEPKLPLGTNKDPYPSIEFTAFGHSEYPMVYAQKIMDENDHNLPNPPYTPTLKSVSLNYTPCTRISTMITS